MLTKEFLDIRMAEAARHNRQFMMKQPDSRQNLAKMFRHNWFARMFVAWRRKRAALRFSRLFQMGGLRSRCKLDVKEDKLNGRSKAE